jgi:hypothetical protein
MNVGIIGLGPFCRSSYIDYLKKNKDKYSINIIFLIELKKNSIDVIDFCKKENLDIKKYIFLDNDEELSNDLNSRTINELKKICSKDLVDIVIISTEPKSHFKYLRYFIDKNVHILIDKPPVCGFECKIGKTLSKKIIYEAKKINFLLENKINTKCVVTTQRRVHTGFLRVKEILSKIVSRYNLPVNYIGCFHSDGMWNMPDELIYRDNHPYRFGYGKIMHSGYHFIDTMFWLQKLNNNIEKYKINATKFDCRDFVRNLNNVNYQQLLKTDRFVNLLKNANLYTGFGELDSHTIFQFKRNDNTVISTVSLNLLQNSFSRRAWDELPKDTYKSNGRLRHEFWNIQIAPVLCVQIHSSQSYEDRNIAEQINFNQGDIGSEDHFDINIFRNKSLIGGKSFEQVKLGSQEINLMKRARFSIIDQLFQYVSIKTKQKNNLLESEFSDHLNSIVATAKIYDLYKVNKYVSRDIQYLS